MMLTRAASRALLQQRRSSRTDKWSPRLTIRNLPEEVLLEIFDSYRQSFQNDGYNERNWNSNKGWFKLAHVCREWRRVVLASPSRLRLRLFITTQRSPRSIALKSLPPLPIIITFRHGYEDYIPEAQNHMISALSFPDRVCGVTITMFDTNSHKSSKKWLAATNQPFPALESLELYCKGTPESDVSPPFLTAPTPHLRRLTFSGSPSTLLSKILSCATSLVDLTLILDSVVNPSPEIQLLRHLQSMSFLSRLLLHMNGVTFPGPPLGNQDVLLPKLTFFRVGGHVTQLKALFACLVAPSLRKLHITPFPISFYPESPTTTVTYLPRFIQNVGKPFFSAQLNNSTTGINLVMSTYSHSTNDPPFIFIVNSMPPIYLKDDEFSATLATVQVVFVVSSFNTVLPWMRDYFPWRSFFKLFRNAKTLRVSHGMEQEVGNILRPDNESSLQLLPALEEIELDTKTRLGTPTRIDKDKLGPIVGPFKPFMDARQQAGRPVNLHWNTDWVLPHVNAS